MAAGRDFGALINERRLALGYSLGQLANRVKATASDVRAWERGQRAPGDEVVGKLADVLELDAEQLVDAAHRIGPDGEAAAPAETGAASEATADAMTPVFSDAADTAVDAEPEDEAAEDEASPRPDAADDAAPGESGADEEGSEADDEPPTALVAADADAGDLDPVRAALPAVSVGVGLGDDAAAMADVPTEAVPIVPAAVAVDEMVAVDEVLAVQAPSRPVPTTQAEPAAKAGPLDPITSFLRVLFDPDRRYLFWVRTVLMIIVFLVFLRVLAWAVPAFFDTLGEILDTIESTTPDTTLPGG